MTEPLTGISHLMGDKKRFGRLRLGSGVCCESVIIAFALGFAVVRVGPVSGADAPSDAPRMGTRIGEMYPDFVLPKLDGGFGRLSDYRGRKVLLVNFASW